MQYKPHILIDHERAKHRINRIGRAASLIFISGYNNPNLRILPTFKRYQFLD